MDYFEFLNKIIQNNTFDSSRLDLDGNKPEIVTDADSTSVNLNGVPIFNLASKDEVNQIRYENILVVQNESTENDVKLSPLELAIQKFFEIDEIKTKVDKDGNGEITEQEAKEFIESLMQGDGNSEDLSLKDFSVILDKYGINLDNYLENGENASDSGLNDNNPLSTSQELTSAPMFQYNSSTNNIMRPRRRSNHNTKTTTQVAKTLDNMSLEELNSEKSKRVDDLNVKLTDLKKVQTGETEGIKAAKQNENTAKIAYEAALDNDETLKEYRQAIKTNIQQIEENDKQISECKNNILDKESVVSNQEQTYKLAQSNLNALKTALSSLVTQENKVDETKRAELSAKISETKTKISEQEKSVENEKQKLETAQKELEDSKTHLGELEAKDKDLQDKKAQYEKIVDERASEVTKAAKNTYNEAIQKVKDVTEQELKTAQTAYNEAKKSVDEINEKIKAVEERKIKLESSFNDVKSLYTELNLGAQGLNYEVFEMAITGYNNLPDSEKNTGMLSIFDTSQSADKERYYLIDLKNKKVVARSVMKTGSGNMNDVSRANKAGSHATLSGFEKIGDEYYSSGMKKQAKIIYGLEVGINDQAKNKGTVVHYASGNHTLGCKGFGPVRRNGRVDVQATNEKMRRICPKGTIMFTAPTNPEQYKRLSHLV